MTRLIPALASHVELQLKWNVFSDFEVPASAACTFKGLDFAHENTVH
jgi:hypothetical protein